MFQTSLIEIINFSLMRYNHLHGKQHLENNIGEEENVS